MVENKQIEKINKLLRKQIIQKFGVVAVAVLAVGTVAYAGSHHSNSSHALTAGVTGFSISPATANAAVGSTITETVQEFSSDPVNSVQASINYDATRLQYVSMAEGTAFPTVAATSTSTAGLVRVGRATGAGKSVSGQNTVVTLTFKVLDTTGNANLSFDPAFSFIVRSSDNVNVMSASTGSTITVKLPAPTITSLAPTSGSTRGGTPVTVTGMNFVNGVTVNIHATPVPVSFVNATTLSFVTPTGTSGPTDITVQNPDGQLATKVNGFTYTAVVPTITSISPNTGTTRGGTTVTITGTNFVSGITLNIHATPVPVTFVNATTITFVTPTGTAGATDITLQNPDGQLVTKVNGFTYLSLAPTISSISPTSGSTKGGTVVTITGTNFVSGITVNIHATPAAVTFVNSTTLTFVTPTGTSGPTDITVQNPDGQLATKISSFTYLGNGDANNDGRVNAIDLSILISHDGQNYPAADFNGDGTVGAADMAILLGKWTW